MPVRKFENRDAGRVAQIMFESFRSFLGERMRNGKPEPEEYWISCSRGETGHSITRAFVAEENGTVIGYICVSANTKSGLGVLHMIGVDPAVFAKGCGRALFEAAETFWRELHMRKIHTCTSHINTRAQAFYKKMGFVEEGRLRDHFFKGVDEIQLAKFYE